MTSTKDTTEKTEHSASCRQTYCSGAVQPKEHREHHKRKPASGTKTVISLCKNHIAPAAAVLSRSFRDDPKLSHSLPLREQRRRVGHHVFGFLLRYGIRYGKAYATSPNLEGIAIWLPSEKAEMTPWRVLRSGATSTIFQVGVRPAVKMLRAAGLVERIQRAEAPAHYRYLFVLGVDPVHQRKGWGSTLLRETMRGFGDPTTPCYLETFAADNVPFYQGHGFRVVKEIRLVNTDLTMWALLREL